MSLNSVCTVLVGAIIIMSMTICLTIDDFIYMKKHPPTRSIERNVSSRDNKGGIGT